MNKLRLFSLIFVMISLVACTNKEKVYNSVIKDSKTGEEILYGYCNVEGIKGDVFKEAYIKEMEEYRPNDSLVNLLSSNYQDITVKVIMGTWCSDTKREVPRLLSVLFSSGYDPTVSENFEAICVDTEKKAEDIDLEPYKFDKVPTIIIYRSGLEIGRIIETPQISIEQDLLDILSK